MRHPGGGRSERAARTVLIASVAMLVGGCAAGRGTLDPQVERGSAPVAGPAVVLVGVTDKREFEASPRDPSIPSLQSAADLNDPSITSRAFARKRGGFGNALGDIVLPEGRTVAGLVGEAVTRGFNQAGYRVLAAPPAAAGDDAATPVAVDVNAFWCWFTPGFAAITVECKSVLVIDTSLAAFASNDVISTRNAERGVASTSGFWMQAVTQCLDAISAEVAQRLAASPPPAPGSPGPAA